MTFASTGVAEALLGPGVCREVMLGHRSVLLVRSGTAVHALDAVCPHAGGPLGDGSVERGAIVCPLHGAAFDLATGRPTIDPHGEEPARGAVEALAVYPVRVTDGMIEVEVPPAAGPRA